MALKPLNYVKKLSPPYRGSAGEVSSILNIWSKVGPGQPNNPVDVWMVQRQISYASSKGAHGTDARVGLPQQSGRFDAVTGFCVYSRRGHGLGI